MDYPGKVITKNQVTPTQTSASGNWTLDDQAAAIKNNNWPVAGVPNPISKSLRFNSADSAYLNRTPASAGNRQTWTWSGWVKFSVSSTATQGIFGVGNSASGDLIQYNNSSYNIRWFINGAASGILETSQVFRDPSAWYHLVFVFDTTNSTSSDRMRMYVNGTRITSFSTATYPSQNYQGNVNTAAATFIGFNTSYNYLSGYLTEVNFIDGQALTPSSFGMTNPQTGQWIPIKYSGTYGTNGFYLNFKDATSTTTLGYDYSGNANNWTTNNFSVTAGSGNDSLTDVPTPWIAYNTTGDVGGVVRGNYATLNPLEIVGAANTFANGNLDVTTSASVVSAALGTLSVSSGKWYCEFTPSSVTGICQVGVTKRPVGDISTNGPAQSANAYVYINSSGNKGNNNSVSAYGATYTSGDVIGVALDLDAGTLVFYKNGVSQGTAYTGLSGEFTFLVGDSGNASTIAGSVNFGQRPFAYTPPAGFLSLCSTNLPTPTIGFGLTNQGDDYMNVALYTGNGTSQSITSVGFQPDLIWFKSRSTVANHALIDAVRGRSKLLFSSLTDAEATSTTTAKDLVSFDANGFTVGVPEQNGSINTNGTTNVAWNWKANGSGSSNTAGTITSTVSANTTSGFSIVTFTGNGTNPSTVGHGLGIAPSMVIVKSRSAIGDWWVYHQSIGATKTLFLSLTDAALTFSPAWNNTAPTSTVFTVGTASGLNVNNVTQVAYCFAAVAGYSAFGSYTGNGSADGPFVYTGFRPRYVMIKRTDSANDWLIIDTSRNPYNVTNLNLWANLSSAEGTADRTDVLSNGFKLRNSLAEHNASGGTYIYAAFAESPFKFANAR